MNLRAASLLGLLVVPLALAGQTELPIRVEPFVQQVAEYEPPTIDASTSPTAAPSPVRTLDAPGEV
ncbi:MAG: hypothetical protein OXG74_19775, partial [Acidobacteria bacterium]|nr:hypothetical protein [Acidobacteriota bacterium]